MRRRAAFIELSTKVVDSVPKLEETLCHEMCHQAVFILDGSLTDQHGPLWRGWAARAQRALPGMQISRCHRYDVFRPHRYQCRNAECVGEALAWCRWEREREDREPGTPRLRPWHKLPPAPPG